MRHLEETMFDGQFAGQEVVDQFIVQILRCGRYDKAATLKLCDWKNNRVPFWETDEDEEESYGEGSTTRSNCHR